MSVNFIGVDVGGTKIAAGLVCREGKILKHYRLPTEAKKGKKVILANISKAIAAVWDDSVVGIGIGIAGLTRHDRGLFVHGPNFPKTFKNIQLAKEVGQSFRVPVTIDNDARCFTLGEALFGQGKGHQVVVGITLGTGIGGGVTMNGQAIRGRDKAAGEVGHMTVDASSNRKCSCGSRGHLEALCSGPAISREYRRQSDKTLLPTDIQHLSERGDRVARDVIDKCGRHLGLGLASIIQITNPDIIIIGGGVSRDKRLLQMASKTCRRAVSFPEISHTPICLSKLGGDAMILGAASLAF